MTLENFENNQAVCEVPHNSTDTSTMAAEELKPYAGKIGYSIYSHIKKHGPQTCEQIEHALNMSHQTASGRITVLRKAGKIIDSGERGENSTGRKAIIWRLTTQQEEILAKDFVSDRSKSELRKKLCKHGIDETENAAYKVDLNDFGLTSGEIYDIRCRIASAMVEIRNDAIDQCADLIEGSDVYFSVSKQKYEAVKRTVHNSHRNAYADQIRGLKE